MIALNEEEIEETEEDEEEQEESVQNEEEIMKRRPRKKGSKGKYEYQNKRLRYWGRKNRDVEKSIIGHLHTFTLTGVVAFQANEKLQILSEFNLATNVQTGGYRLSRNIVGCKVFIQGDILGQKLYMRRLMAYEPNGGIVVLGAVKNERERETDNEEDTR